MQKRKINKQKKQIKKEGAKDIYVECHHHNLEQRGFDVVCKDCGQVAKQI
jgi:hypothetical protein